MCFEKRSGKIFFFEGGEGDRAGNIENGLGTTKSVASLVILNRPKPIWINVAASGRVEQGLQEVGAASLPTKPQTPQMHLASVTQRPAILAV